MKFTVEIKSRWNASVKFSCEVETSHNASGALKLGLAVKEAVQSGAYLRDADLRGAGLRGANLCGTDLSGADLRGADLRGADLSGAGLRGADLSGADLRDADLIDADLRGADLSGAYLYDAVLRDAYLYDAVLRDAYLRDILETVPLIPNIDAAILASIEKNRAAMKNGLRMASWHGMDCDETNWCETTHCRAGYAICLAGKKGFELERKYGPANAGMLLYLKSTPDAPIPNWIASNEDAMADMRARAAKQTQVEPT